MRNGVLIIKSSFLLVLLSASNLVAHAQYQEQDYVARHLKEDREWARKIGLAASTVRKLRLLADVPDDSDALIDSNDAKRLRSRNQLLLVTASGNGHCLALYVFERRRTDYWLIWSATEMHNGAGYCRESPYNPQAYVQSGRIVVRVPVFDYQRGVPKATDFYTYVWNSGSYQYAGRHSVKVRRRGRISYPRTAQSKNGMHPTANSVTLMRETCFISAVRRGA
jgi:hypothetical protein